MKKHSIASQFKDDRGQFICFISDFLSKYKDLNYTETVGGNTRGDHYHKDTNELFIILSGDIEVVIEKIQNDKIINTVKYNFSKFDIFEIEPYENHTIKALTDCSWISLLTTSFDEENQDFHKI